MKREEQDKIGRAPAATPGGPAYRPHDLPRRREEDMVSVRFTSKIAGRIGDFEITNVDIYAEQDGKRVTANEVVADRKFDIVAEYDIKNHKTGIAFMWSTCMTVFNETEGVATGSDLYTERGIGWEHGKDRVATKVLVSTMFRVKLWAHQEALAPGKPPQSEW